MTGLPANPPPAPPPPAREPAAVRAYFAFDAAFRRAGALLQATHDGVWLGVLGRDDLHALDQWFYERNASYHQDAHNLRGLFPWEETALESFGGCGRIGLIGAGGGREVLALSRMGYEVDAYECNPQLVDFANGFLPRHGCAARVRHLSRDAAPEAETPFDGMILGWSAYTLIPGRAHRIRLLRQLRPLVKPGGPILLSFFTRARDGVQTRVSAAVANGIRALLRRERVERGDALSPNFVHYFVAKEIGAELREAGWDPRTFTPHGTGSRDSGWAIALARDPAPPA